ncbi:hypothetical protein TNCV_3301771 [Trichonephila clavipes]|nr:hypothetical protein TNCV_3301771 [Trichonephila clavipes]
MDRNTNDDPNVEQKRISIRDDFKPKSDFSPPKIRPYLSRDSNPSPLDYKPSLVTTIVVGRQAIRMAR